MTVVWLTGETTRDATAEALRAGGGDVKERLGFEPLTTITVIAGATVIVAALRKLFQDQRYRGVIVDITKDPMEIREMPGWERGHVLVVTAEGPQFHEFGNGDGLKELLAGLGK